MRKEGNNVSDYKREKRLSGWVREIEQASSEKSKCKHYCTCGHSMVIPEFVNYQICDFCGNKVYTKKGLKEKLGIITY